METERNEETTAESAADSAQADAVADLELAVESMSEKYKRGYADGRTAGWNDWRTYLNNQLALCAMVQFPIDVVRILTRSTERLKSALEPFSALIDRHWSDKLESIEKVRKGAYVSEFHAISMADILNAIDALAEWDGDIGRKA